MRIITGWTGDYYSRNKEKYLDACLESWRKAYPSAQICVYVDREGFEESNIPFGRCLEWNVVSPRAQSFYDCIRFEAFQLQKESFMWIDPDIFIKKPYPEEVFNSTWVQDDLGYQGFRFGLVSSLLSQESLQRLLGRYNLSEDHFLVSECYILSPMLGYVLGTEVVQVMKEVENENLMVHREITEHFAGTVVKAWEPSIGYLDRVFPREEYLVNLRIQNSGK